MNFMEREKNILEHFSLTLRVCVCVLFEGLQVNFPREYYVNIINEMIHSFHMILSL